MLKPVLLALAGLVAATPAAMADTTLPILPRPDLGAIPAPLQSHDIELCGRFGIACSVPGAQPHGELSDLLDLIPLAQADAARRWALLAEDWAEIAELYEEYAPYPLPTPDLPEIAGGYGWQHGQIADITALMEDVQERLDGSTAPVHVMPRPRFDGLHPFNTSSDQRGYLCDYLTTLRPHTLFVPGNVPGQSLTILP